jgi:hypothetical protein
MNELPDEPYAQTLAVRRPHASAIRQFFPRPQTRQEEPFLVRGRRFREILDPILNQDDHPQDVRTFEAFGHIVVGEVPLLEEVGSHR